MTCMYFLRCAVRAHAFFLETRWLLSCCDLRDCKKIIYSGSRPFLFLFLKICLAICGEEALAVVEAVTKLRQVVSSDAGKDVSPARHGGMLSENKLGIYIHPLSIIVKRQAREYIDYIQPSIPQLERMQRGKRKSYSCTSERGV